MTILTISQKINHSELSPMICSQLMNERGVNLKAICKGVYMTRRCNHKATATLPMTYRLILSSHILYLSLLTVKTRKSSKMMATVMTIVLALSIPFT